MLLRSYGTRGEKKGEVFGAVEGGETLDIIGQGLTPCS